MSYVLGGFLATLGVIAAGILCKWIIRFWLFFDKKRKEKFIFKNGWVRSIMSGEYTKSDRGGYYSLDYAYQITKRK